MSFFTGSPYRRQKRTYLLLVVISVLFAGCHSRPRPSLQITHVPPDDPGGPARLDYIEGRARGTEPGQQIVLYTRGGGIWWIQPYIAHPFTKIQADSTWKNATHLGTEYAALLVESGYHPPSKMMTVPKEENGVVAVITAKGNAVAPTTPKVIHFSGYDWTALAAGSDRGGESNIYDPANAWTDANGYLHLRMVPRDGGWACAEVNLNRSLGYGSYRFVVRDSSHLEPSAVLGMFTLDLAATAENRSELDIELSRWGNPAGKNAQYVIQPFYVPENVARFTVPSGPLTHTFTWEPGVASFKTVLGAAMNRGAKIISSHVFTSGVPTPAAEKVHIDLFDFHDSKYAVKRSAEVVIEKFEYLP